MQKYGVIWFEQHAGVFETTGWDTQMAGSTKLTGRWLPADNANARCLSELLREGSKVEVMIEGQDHGLQAWLSIDHNGDARLYVSQRPQVYAPD